MQIRFSNKKKPGAVFLILFLLLSSQGWPQGKHPKGGKGDFPVEANIREVSGKSASEPPGTYPKTRYGKDSLFLEATTLYLTEKTDQAYNTYLNLLEKDPRNATAAYQIANILASEKQFSQALIYAEKACLIEPENEWFQFLLAQLYQNSRHFDQAARTYGKLQEIRPENLDYAYQQANMHVYSGKLEDAISVYDRLQEKLGPSDTWTMQKYKIYMGLGKEKEARKEIEVISKAVPGQVKYLEMLAQMCMKEKDYKHAYAYLKKVLELKPDDPYIYVSLADYYRNTGNFKEAFHALEKAVRNPKLDFQTKLNVLQAYYTGKDELKPEGDLIGQALQLFSALNTVHPNEPQGFLTHARFLILINRDEQAVPLLEKTLYLDTSSYRVWDLLLYACNMIQDTSRLQKYGKRATISFPEQPAPPMYLGIAAVLKGDYAHAVEYAKASLERDRAKNDYIQKVNWQILGDSYFELGQTDKSISAYEHLFSLDPTDPYVRNNYAYYLALTGRDLAKAEAIASQLCGESPKNATFLDTYGWVLYRMGHYEKARTHVKAALENGAEKDATVLEHYGDILYRLGMEDKAKTYWEKAASVSRKQSGTALKQKIENPEQWIR